MLFEASFRVNPDYYPLLSDKVLLSAISIPFIPEFPASTVSRIFCWFK